MHKRERYLTFFIAITSLNGITHQNQLIKLAFE